MTKYTKATDLKKDFGPEWAKRLSVRLPANPYLVTLEQEAWNDAVDGHSDTEDEDEEDEDGLLTPDEFGIGTPVKETEEEKSYGYSTPPPTPDKDELTRRLRTIQLLDAPDSRYQTWLIKASKSEEKCEVGIAEEKEEEEMSFSTKIMLFVMIAVLLHGSWTHWDEAEKRGQCRCADFVD